MHIAQYQSYLLEVPIFIECDDTIILLDRLGGLQGEGVGRHWSLHPRIADGTDAVPKMRSRTDYPAVVPDPEHLRSTKAVRDVRACQGSMISRIFATQKLIWFRVRQTVVDDLACNWECENRARRLLDATYLHRIRKQASLRNNLTPPPPKLHICISAHVSTQINFNKSPEKQTTQKMTIKILMTVTVKVTLSRSHCQSHRVSPKDLFVIFSNSPHPPSNPMFYS